MAAGRPSTGSGHVVVCDAEPAAAQAIARILGEAGFDASTCATAAACEELVVTTSPVLVTLPTLLPDQDGFALVRRLCAQRDAVADASRSVRAAAASAGGDQRLARRPAHPRVVMVSALQGRHRARAAGADAFLSKPARASQIVRVACQLTAVRPRRRPVPLAEAPGTDAAALSEVIARTARAVAAVEQPEEALAAVLAVARTYLGASGAALLRSEVGRLVPVGSSGLGAAERALDETDLIPRGGGGYPIVLAGWLEGVLLLADIPAPKLAAQEAALAPLLDLAAAALRNSRLLADLRRQRQDREAGSFARLSELPPAAATAHSFGVTSLRTAAPGAFGELARRYGELLDLALEQRGYRVDHRLPEALRALAGRLGAIRATPRDVIEIHTSAVRGKTARVVARKAQAYLEEAQMMVLELMGHLASYYRGQAVLAWPGGRAGGATAAPADPAAGVPAARSGDSAGRPARDEPAGVEAAAVDGRESAP